MKGKINGKMKGILLIAVFILSTITLAIPLALAQVTDVWVAPAPLGVDTNPGTEVAPYLTIQKGIDNVATGYTVYVAAGDYVLSGTIDITTDDITLVSTAGAATTTIDASGSLGTEPLHTVSFEAGRPGIIVEATGVTIDGFTILNPKSAGIYLRDADDATIKNNILTFDALWTGIDISPSAAGVTVTGNVLDEDATMTVHGTGSTISGNTFGNLIHVWPLGGIIDGTTITGNTFPVPVSTQIGGIYLHVTEGASTISDILIEGNIFSDRRRGIHIGPGALLTLTDCTIKDNDISGSTQNGIMIMSGITITNLDITGNDIYENTENGIEINSWDATTASLIKNNNIWGNDVGGGNDDFGITVNVAGKTVNANLNWWGHPSEPSHGEGEPKDSHDIKQTVGTVTHSSWLIGSYPDGLEDTGNVGDEGTVSGAIGTSTTPGGLLKVYLDEIHAWDATKGTGLLASTYAKADTSFNVEITIPEAIVGSHSILIYDDIADALIDSPVTAFTVEPEIVLDPKAGIKGDTIDVTGTGFGKAEVITISYNPQLVTTPAEVKTNAFGSFDASFVIPDDVIDDVTITATGLTSYASHYTVLSGGTVITLTPNKGLTGTTVTVVGRGFTASKTVDLRWYFATSAEILADGYDIYPYLTKVDDHPISSTGGFTTSFIVPDVETGAYMVRAIDSKDPNPEEAEAAYTVKGATTITLSPTSGIAGDPITVTGVWFTKSKTVIIYYDGTLLETTTTAATGTYGFTKSINIPDDATVGAHTIKAMDSEGLYDTATLTVVIEVTTIETGSDSYDSGDKISYNIHSTVKFYGDIINIVIKDPDAYEAWEVDWALTQATTSSPWVVTYQEQQTVDLTLPSDAKSGTWTWKAEYHLAATPSTKQTATGTFLVGEPVGPQPDIPAETTDQEAKDSSGVPKTSFVVGETVLASSTVTNTGTQNQPMVIIVQWTDPQLRALAPIFLITDLDPGDDLTFAPGLIIPTGYTTGTWTATIMVLSDWPANNGETIGVPVTITITVG